MWSKLQQLPLYRPKKTIVTTPRYFELLGYGRLKMCFGDECQNGHNTFTMTVDGGDIFGGCMHDEAAKLWPEYAKYIKWHLVSTDGPLHYIANSLYLATKKHLNHFRTTAIWPDATEEDMSDATVISLESRLPALMEEFATDMFKLFNLEN